MKLREHFKINPTPKSKIIVFILTVILFFFTAVSIFTINQMITDNIYKKSKEELLLERYDSLILKDSEQILTYLHKNAITSKSNAATYCEQKNFTAVRIWTNSTSDTELQRYKWYWHPTDDTSGLTIKHIWRRIGTEFQLWDDYAFIKHAKDYIYVEITVAQNEKRVDDAYWDIERSVSATYFWRYPIYVVGFLLFLLSLGGFIYLMWASGRRKDDLTIHTKWRTTIPFDIFTIACVAIILCFFLDIRQTMPNISAEANLWGQIRATLECILLEMIVIAWSMYLALHIKLKTLWNHMLILKLAKWLQRVLFAPLGQKLCPKILFGWKQFRTYVVKTPFLLRISFVLFLLLLLEYIILHHWFGKHHLYSDIVLFWLMEKCIIIPVVFYFAIHLRKLKESGKALADGDLTHTTNTRFMVGDLKEHGKNLNSIANGMTIAVEERLKSERMKTELITNVTHDLKTPLTSIMNYADLLKKELSNVHIENPPYADNISNETISDVEVSDKVLSKEISSIIIETAKFERIQEYSSVLHRHSKRLKRLIEDLLEASKAATGNLDVYLEPCEASIMLTQAAGEFEQRLESVGLTLITKYPEEPLHILADGRRLWRIFDNLLSNVCKYAQVGTRVYLTLEKKNDFAVITFKNTSRDALDIAPEALMERFTRADASRHTEGNGLGLAIAKSLTELQKGTLDLTIDGDLFKVTLQFPIHKMES